MAWGIKSNFAEGLDGTILEIDRVVLGSILRVAEAEVATLPAADNLESLRPLVVPAALALIANDGDGLSDLVKGPPAQVTQGTTKVSSPSLLIETCTFRPVMLGVLFLMRHAGDLAREAQPHRSGDVGCICKLGVLDALQSVFHRGTKYRVTANRTIQKTPKLISVQDIKVMIVEYV